jgi:hypothetical protein
MVAGVLDLSFMGVTTIWNHDLGQLFGSQFLTPFSQIVGSSYLYRLVGATDLPPETDWERIIEAINIKANRGNFEGIETKYPHHRQLCLAVTGWAKSDTELDEAFKMLEDKGQFTKAAVWALCENMLGRAVEILRRAGGNLVFVALALDIQASNAAPFNKDTWDQVINNNPQMMGDPYLNAIYALISTGNLKAVANETSLPLRERVGIALRNFQDQELSKWIQHQTDLAISTGDIEGIVLLGVTDKLIDLLSVYISKFGDYQTAVLLMSFTTPKYIEDYRFVQWRNEYKQHHQKYELFIPRTHFNVQTTKLSRRRDGTTGIKPPPRQVTLRCLNCNSPVTNDLENTASPPQGSKFEKRNALIETGISGGISCPRCGKHLARCALCLRHLGTPRVDKQMETEKQAAMANFMVFCMRCDHVMHADHAEEWFSKHNECPVASCRCPCNRDDQRIRVSIDNKTEWERLATERIASSGNQDGGGGRTRIDGDDKKE